MKLSFKVQVSSKEDSAYINTALWQIDPDKEPIVIDREFTDWRFEEENKNIFLYMEWRNIYEWDGENETPITYENTPEYIDENGNLKGRLVGLEVEDDAPDRYGIIDLNP